MATNNQLKFYKGASFTTTPKAGVIWFNTTDRSIYVYNGTDWERYAGLVDANWNASTHTLTLTSAKGEVITVNDLASAASVAAEIQRVEGFANTAQNAADAAQADADALEKALGSGFSASSTVAAQLAAVKATADKAAVKTDVDGQIATLQDAKADKTTVASDIATAKQAAIDTAAADATTKANAAEANAKAYADDLNTSMDSRVDVLEAAIGANGSVNESINNAIGALDANKTGEGTFVDVTVKQVNGVITEVSVAENDIASAEGLSDEVARATAAEQALAARITSLDAVDTGRVSVLEAQVTALSSATHFLGVKDKLEDVATPAAGDIVIVGAKEYVYDDAKGWVELGDTTAEQGRISTLEAAVERLDNEQDTQDGLISANASAITTLQNRAKTIEDTMATDTELEGVRSALDGRVTTLESAKTDHASRIEALENTSDALGTTYVKVSDYTTDKTALAQKDNDLQGEIDAAEDRLDTLEAAITRLDGEQATQDDKISANEEAIEALQEWKAGLDVGVTSVTGDADVTASPTTGAVSLSLNKATAVAQNDSKVVTAGAVYDALCWVEFN